MLKDAVTLYSHELEAYLKRLLGETDLNHLLRMELPPPAIRANTLKCSTDRLRQHLNRWGVRYTSHPVVSEGLVLKDDSFPLSNTLPYFQGHFFFQGLSSQLPVLALDPQPGESVLDMAAAPGSKSVQIGAALQNRGRLLLCDVANKRMQSLLTNTDRAGLCNSMILNVPGQRLGRWMPESFDKVLLDAPCTALAKTRKQLEAERRWSHSALTRQAKSQFHLLTAALKAVKVGGLVVYSTCSLSVEENEALMDQLLSTYPDQVDLEPVPFTLPETYDTRHHTHINGRKLDSRIERTLRIRPYPVPVESFFVARIRKLAPLRHNPGPVPDSKPLLPPDDPAIRPILEELERVWGLDPALFEPYRFYTTRKRLYMVDAYWQQLSLDGFVKAGLPLAIQKFQSWKLTTASVQLLNRHITRSLLELNDSDLNELFARGKMPWSGAQPGYYALVVDGNRVALVSFFDGMLKTHLPHEFDLIR
jgi:16S rRNA (cytosine1407-C5)-methyltransferase